MRIAPPVWCICLPARQRPIVASALASQGTFCFSWFLGACHLYTSCMSLLYPARILKQIVTGSPGSPMCFHGSRTCLTKAAACLLDSHSFVDDRSNTASWWGNGGSAARGRGALPLLEKCEASTPRAQDECSFHYFAPGSRDVFIHAFCLHYGLHFTHQSLVYHDSLHSTLSHC